MNRRLEDQVQQLQVEAGERLNPPSPRAHAHVCPSCNVAYGHNEGCPKLRPFPDYVREGERLCQGCGAKYYGLHPSDCPQLAAEKAGKPFVAVERRAPWWESTYINALCFALGVVVSLFGQAVLS